MNDNSIVFYILTFIAILVIGNKLLRLKLRNEKFIPTFTLTYEQKPDILELTYPYSSKTKDIITLLKNEHKIQYHQVSDNDITIKDGIITDSFTLLHNNNLQKNNKMVFLSGTNSNKCAYFIRSLDTSNIRFDDDNIVIGYINDLDAKLIDMIIGSMKTRKPLYNTKKIIIEDQLKMIDKSVFTQKNIDVLFIFETLESQVITKRLDTNMKVEVWDYADSVDIHTIKVQIPYIRKKNIDFSLYFPQLKGKLDNVSSVFVIDVIVAIDEEKTKQKNIDTELGAMIKHYDHADLINLYSQFFKVSDISARFANDKNEFYKKRSSMQILEQFESNDFTFDIISNVNGFYDSLSKKLYLYTNIINGIPLKKGSVFKLQGQVRLEQNGLYTVLDVADKQSTMLKVDTTSKSSSKADDLDVGYVCYEHRDITTKAACESPYDELGNKKNITTYWDKPCEAHTDCPFYQANGNYKNYRGGCIDGRCEFPIGVKPVSYRYFDGNTKPVCHNCAKDAPFCCEQQKNKTEYPKLSTPDYAFELDSFERLQTNTW